MNPTYKQPPWLADARRSPRYQTGDWLARFALKSLWLSRLTANPLGRLIANAPAAHWVDTSRIVSTDEDRVGVLFFEIAKLPRGSRVLYDSRHSAVSRMHPGDLPVDVFLPDGAQAFHTIGDYARPEPGVNQYRAPRPAAGQVRWVVD